MRALFVSNQRKTEFFDGVAQQLRRMGVVVSWITLSNRWRDFLLARNWRREDILNLAEFGPEWRRNSPRAEDLALLEKIDRTAQIGVRHALMVDREINRWPGARALAWAAIVAREIDSFIARQNPDASFGETTWAPELLTSEIMRARNRLHLQHATMRVPSERFGFFPGVLHDHYLRPVTAPTEAQRARAREIITDLRERAVQPYYMAQNVRPHRLRRHWAEEARIAIGGANRYDHSVPTLATRTTRRLVARAKAALQSRGVFETPPATPHRPYALVTLHKQPEASVDVWGFSAQNQLENIKALARLLPFGWEIWVKEHAVATGDRTRAWYDAVRTIPGARLIDPHASGRKLVLGASLVASVSGTASLEAGLLGIPAITFAPMFYSPVLAQSHCTPASMTRDAMDGLLARGAPAKPEKFLADMLANSWEGIVSDFAGSPEAGTPENLGRVASATHQVLASLKSSSSPRG